MTNYEHYIEQIDKMNHLGLKFAIKKEKPTTIAVCGGLKCEDCLFGDGCSAAKLKWADEEYAESAVDWSKVPMDTKIRVKGSEAAIWEARHFAKYFEGKVYAWKDGKTSFTAECCYPWNYAKLAEEEK